MNPADSLSYPFFCDVFCEDGTFDLAQTRRILEVAQALGFRLKLHVDEFAPLGGTPLAVALGAVTVDHIVTTPPEHIALLAASETIGVALPGTPFGLAQRDYSPGRALIDQDGVLALATDLNPGTTWCESMQMMIALACRYMRLLPAEALTAATLNAAHAAGSATWSAVWRPASSLTSSSWTRTTIGCWGTGIGRTWHGRLSSGESSSGGMIG